MKICIEVTHATRRSILLLLALVFDYSWYHITCDAAWNESSFEVPQAVSTHKEAIQEVVLHCFGNVSKDSTFMAVYALIKQRLEFVACLMSSNKMRNTITVF